MITGAAQDLDGGILVVPPRRPDGQTKGHILLASSRRSACGVPQQEPTWSTDEEILSSYCEMRELLDSYDFPR